MLELTEFALGIAAGAAITIAARALLERFRRAPSVGLDAIADAPSSEDRSPSPDETAFEGDEEEGSLSPSPRAPRAGSRPGLPPGIRASERVILHLYRAGATTDGHALPTSLTQAGMVKALGVTQSAVTRTLGRLRAAGVLQEDRQFILGRARRLKVYRLTPLGESLARNLDRKHRGGGRGG